MILTFEATDAEGRRTTDLLEAADLKNALEELRRRGLFVTHIAETTTQSASALRQDRRSQVDVPRLPLRVLVLFTRQMAMMLRAGSGLVPAVQAIKRQMTNPQHAAVLERIAADLEEGSTLTTALRNHPATFDAVYCAVVAAGEASAALGPMFDRLSDIVRNRRAVRNKILGALAYPALLVTMCGSIICVLLFFVLPRFADMFDQLGVQTPATTQFLLATGDLLRQYWLLCLFILMAGVAAVVWIVGSDRGRQWLSDAQLFLPVIGPLRGRLIQAQILRTMGTLLESGVGVLETLELAATSTRNRRFRTLFDKMEAAVTSGGQISTAFQDSGLVQPHVCQAVRTGEDSGNLGQAMTFCADIQDEANAELINTTMKLLEPAILIIMGFLVGGVALSLFVPLFDLTSAVQ